MGRGLVEVVVSSGLWLCLGRWRDSLVCLFVFCCFCHVGIPVVGFNDFLCCSRGLESEESVAFAPLLACLR